MQGGCSAAEPFALQVLGDSMLPEFEHGAIIIVDPGGIIEDGAYVVAQHAEEYVLRQLRRPDGRYVLAPLNAQYDAVEVPGVEAIMGVVVQKAGRRRRDRKHYV
ncbi:S24 family peptidase [Ectothiorhodospiraceae bacterium 2226]|nr:S24 family peptidase [Ectothiorhodospiraceae bacterium 2226]